MSWLTNDVLCCGKRQWLIFGTKCWPRGILGTFGTGGATELKTLCTWLVLYWKVLLTRACLIKGACAMGAVILGAKTGLGMGRSLRWAGSELCCCVFGLGGALGCRGTFIEGAGWFVVGKEEEWRLVLGGQNYFVVGSIFAGPNYFWADLMFKVRRIVKFEVVRWEITRLHYFDFLALRTSVVEWAVEWAVKKPLRRVRKAGDLRFLG